MASETTEPLEKLDLTMPPISFRAWREANRLYAVGQTNSLDASDIEADFDRAIDEAMRLEREHPDDKWRCLAHKVIVHRFFAHACGQQLVETIDFGEQP